MSAVLLIPAAIGQSQLRPEQLRAVPAGVLTALGQVADPRRRRGVRHGCTAVLAIAVCAVLAGANSYVGIAEWAHDLPLAVRRSLGLGRRAQSESTIRRVLQRVDPDGLDRALCGWLAPSPAQPSPAQPSRAQPTGAGRPDAPSGDRGGRQGGAWCPAARVLCCG